VTEAGVGLLWRQFGFRFGRFWFGARARRSASGREESGRHHYCLLLTIFPIPPEGALALPSVRLFCLSANWQRDANLASANESNGMNPIKTDDSRCSQPAAKAGARGQWMRACKVGSTNWAREAGLLLAGRPAGRLAEEPVARAHSPSWRGQRSRRQ